MRRLRHGADPASAPADELAAVYDKLFSTGKYEQHRQDFEALQRGEPRWARYRALLLRRIERRVRGRRLFEVGGGTGGFGVLARSRGWDYADFDISEVAADFARRLGHKATVFPADSTPPLGQAQADVVTAWEVIEHVWEVQDYLQALHRGLRPGGLLVMSTPNWRYVDRLAHWGPLSSPPIHCNFFDRDSLSSPIFRRQSDQNWPAARVVGDFLVSAVFHFVAMHVKYLSLRMRAS